MMITDDEKMLKKMLKDSSVQGHPAFMDGQVNG